MIFKTNYPKFKHRKITETKNATFHYITLQIANLIEQSFTLKKQSEYLLEVSKRVVEIAIKENEAVALKFIKKETA